MSGADVRMTLSCSHQSIPQLSSAFLPPYFPASPPSVLILLLVCSVLLAAGVVLQRIIFQVGFAIHSDFLRSLIFWCLTLSSWLPCTNVLQFMRWGKTQWMMNVPVVKRRPYVCCPYFCLVLVTSSMWHLENWGKKMKDIGGFGEKELLK